MKAKLAEIRKDLNVELEKVGAIHGVALSLGNISYTKNNFTVKMTGVFAGGLTKEEEAYDRHASFYKLPPRGMTVTTKIRGEEITFVGFNTRATKRPVIIRKNGKNYVTSIASAQQYAGDHI